MRLSRRDFLKLAGASGALSALPLDLINKAFGGNGDPRVIWHGMQRIPAQCGKDHYYR
jgi:hypothetical protein